MHTNTNTTELVQRSLRTKFGQGRLAIPAIPSESRYIEVTTTDNSFRANINATVTQEHQSSTWQVGEFEYVRYFLLSWHLHHAE